MNTAFKTNWSECVLRLVIISDHSYDIENVPIKCPDSDFKITLSRSCFEQSYNLILSGIYQCLPKRHTNVFRVNPAFVEKSLRPKTDTSL